MTDLATLGIKIDSSQVKSGVADLDKLTAAGARAEAATVGLGGGIKGAGVQAAAMATAAQASARAAMDQAAGFKASASAARVNTLAMRETLVVARELARGNFTRIPGSLSLLAQGIGSQGGFSAFAATLSQQLGLVKKVQDAELAEAAVAAENAAMAVRSAAEKAAANVIAADTEIALAEAQVRVTAGTSAEAAAQVRLAEAHQAVAAAAGEAAIAEDALAVAQGRANEAQAASAAATRTVIGGSAVGLLGIAAVAGVAYGAFKQFQDQVKDSRALDGFAESLNLTNEQIKQLGGSISYAADGTRKISDLTVTFGDVMAGVWQEITANSQGAWGNMQSAASAGLSNILGFWDKTSAAISAGLWTLGDIAKDVFQFIGQQIGQSFYDGVNKAIDALNSLNAKIPKALGGGDANLIPHLKADTSVATLGGLGATIRRQSDANYAAALAQNRAAGIGIEQGAIQHARNRYQALSDSNKPKNSPRPKRNPADDEIAKLDAQIKGENELAQAYLTSDAAVIKAQADQKAMTLAVEKHATAAQTATLKNKELALSIATISADGAKEINNLTYEADSRKKVNDMVAAGLIPASQANNYMQMEAQLRPLIAAQSLAEGQAKATLTAEIERLTKAYADNQAQISRGQALQQIAANDNETAKLRLEASLIGASNRERAVALAQLEATQALVNMPGLSPEDQANFINSEVNKALAAVQTPWQQFAASVPQTAEAIHDSFENIALKGVDSLAQGITDVITGAKSLKQAFRETAQSIIADIVQMIVKMLIFRALSSIFGSALGGGGGIPSASPTFGSANGNIFSGGNVIPFSRGGVVTGPTLFPMSGGRTGMMGEAGAEAVLPLGRDSHGRMGVRANDNKSGPIELVVSFGSAPDFAPYVESVSQSHAQQAVIVSVRHTNDTVRKISRPKMMGGG